MSDNMHLDEPYKITVSYLPVLYLNLLVLPPNLAIQSIVLQPDHVVLSLFWPMKVFISVP